MTHGIRWLALLGLALAVPTLAREPAAGEDGQDGARPFRVPPQEAQDACAKLALGAACGFTFDGRAHQGVCRRGPEGQGPVACAPHRGPGHQGGQGPGTEQGREGAKAPPYQGAGR